MTTQHNILVLNCGSSSLKFAIVDIKNTKTLLDGIAEQLNTPNASMKITYGSDEHVSVALLTPYNHLEAVKVLITHLNNRHVLDKLSAIGHRVVHGGEKFTQPAVIDNSVMKAIELTSELAPLHNPANIVGIKCTQELLPSLPQVAVFDTAFHQTMPEKAYLYGIDKDLYHKYQIRRYGFHGTSHFYVSRQAALFLNVNISKCSLITVHLGNGCSVCAVENGCSIDTSLGMTPVEGLVMGTRSGDLDPGLIIYLLKHLNYSADDIDNLINNKSGLLGLSKISNDCRKLEQAMNSNDPIHAKSAKLALDVFCYRVAKYIAGYTVALSHLNGLVFTGGIGENSTYVRSEVIKQLSILGIKLDATLNNQVLHTQTCCISKQDSRFPVLVIPTNEEMVIAQQAAALIGI